MIKVLVIEDEELAALRLKKMLLQCKEEISVIEMLDSIESSVIWLNSHETPDLIFLDIQLSDGISFEIFNRVELKCPVIFVTAYDTYALKAFELNSIDYLLKPLRQELLNNSIGKYLKIKQQFSSSDMLYKMQQIIESYSMSGKTYKTRFLINKGDAIITVKAKEIAYFLAEEKVVLLVLNNSRKYIVNYSLDQLEQVLDPAVFFRINRQFIISEHSIDKISNYFNYKLKLKLLPPAGEDVLVSKSRVAEFKQWLER